MHHGDRHATEAAKAVDLVPSSGSDPRLKQLLSRLGRGTFRLPKVHPAPMLNERLQTLGVGRGGRRVVVATGRSAYRPR